MTSPDRLFASVSLPLLAAALALAGCGGDAPDDSPVTRVDSAGREIVVSSAQAWREGQEWRVSPEPVLSIGVVDGDDAYQLFQVADVWRRSDGSFVVANGGTRDIRIFDAEGEHLRTVGGPGQGPGEFGYPRALIPGADRGFTVVDRVDLVRFDADGAFLGRETFDRQRWTEVTGALGRSEGGLRLPDGRILAPFYAPEPAGEPRAGPPYRPEITIALVDPASGAVDTVTHIGGIRQQLVDVGGRTRPMVGPFAPSGRWFSGRDGTVVVYDGAVPQVERLDPDGRHRILRWTAEPEPIAADEIEAWKELQRNASWARGQLPDLEAGWAAMDMPTEKAVVTDARPSLDGSTWVRTSPRIEEGGGRARWMVFGSDGGWLGSVELPGGFTPHEIGGDYVLGIEHDPVTEVETLRMFGLEKGPG